MTIVEEEADAKLRAFRQQCVRDFINRLNRQQKEWESTFREILAKSQEVSEIPIPLQNNRLVIVEKPPELEEPPVVVDLTTHEDENLDQPDPPVVDLTDYDNEDYDHPDPCPRDLHEYFTNIVSVREFVSNQELLERNRQLFVDINSNAALKPFKNDINLFIRTQINSISNSDFQHLSIKIKLLTSLFSGRGVNFQDRFVNALGHPQGQLFAMDLAAQTFVTVGTRLVNSVPAIAKSMATVINGIVKNNLPIFKDLIMGHLQERCPYLVPMYPRRSDYRGQPDHEIKYLIASGYLYDSKTQAVEAEEKYLARMRSMVLIYACILVPEYTNQAWTWLTSFLSLKPRPVITATVLQAFLQEASRSMSSTYGRQYKKLLDFIKTDYMKMIEEVTTKNFERQSLIKLKNFLSNDSNLIAPPTISSIFGVVKLS